MTDFIAASGEDYATAVDRDIVHTQNARWMRICGLPQRALRTAAEFVEEGWD